MESVLEKYQAPRIATAPRGHLVIILYDIIIKALDRAVDNFVQKKYDDASKNIHKAQNIFSELLTYLNIDEGGELSISLYRLCKYYKSQLREANLSRDKEKIKHMIKQTKELRAAWGRNSKSGQEEHSSGHQWPRMSQFYGVISGRHKPLSFQDPFIVAFNPHPVLNLLSIFSVKKLHPE